MAASLTIPSSSPRSSSLPSLRPWVLILGFVLVPVGILAVDAAATPATTDFFCFWTGARLTIDGRDPYDAATWGGATGGEHVDMFGARRSGNCPGRYAYPLTTAVAMAPFGALPLAIAAVFWQAIILLTTGVGVALIARAAGLQPVGGIVLAILVGASQPFEQTVVGAQFAGLMLFATGLLADARRGNVVVGTLLAGLKPHAIPLAVVVRVRRMGLAGLGSAATPLVALLVASLVIHAAWPGEWLGELVGERRDMFVASATLWALGTAAGVAWSGPALLALTLIGLFAAWRRATRSDPLDLLAIALLAWQLVVPYGLSADQLAPLATAWGAILRRALPPPAHRGLIVALAIIAVGLPWYLRVARFDVLASADVEVASGLAPVGTALLLAAAITMRPRVRMQAPLPS